jgi:hypothetical protein
VSFTLVCPTGKRSQDAAIYIDQLCQLDPGIARANHLVQAFLAIVRERRGNALEAWMAEATDSDIAEVARFARGLRDDLHAIQGGLTLAWSHGRVERLGRTLNEATVNKFYNQTHQHLKEHFYAFLMAYNFAKRLKTFRGLTPYEYIRQCWQIEPERFTINPSHHTLGLNT